LAGGLAFGIELFIPNDKGLHKLNVPGPVDKAPCKPIATAPQKRKALQLSLKAFHSNTLL